MLSYLVPRIALAAVSLMAIAAIGPCRADNWGSPTTWNSFTWACSASIPDTYTYDAQGRLASITYGCGGSVTYSYDAAGNRTAVVKAS